MFSFLKSKGANKMTAETSTTTQETRPNRGGLEGVVAATTTISKVEGTAGRLIYRGYNIHDLARTTSFEEVASLLWFGHLPNEEELLDLKIRLLADRTMPDAILRILSDLPATIEP